MEQPPGYTDPQFPQHVCRLKRALYGLKQAPRAWFHRFSSFLLKLGFHSSQADSSLFVYHSSLGTVYLLLYVDDMIITGSTPSLLMRRIYFSIKQYALDLLQRASMIDAKPISTPFVVGQHLSEETLFSDPTDHFRALKRILRYVKGIAHHGLQLHKQSTRDLLGYSDADWAGCPDTRRSTTGYAIFFGANLISWSSKKQSTSLVQLLRDLHVTLSVPPKILCDNQSAIFMAVNPVTRPQSKYIAIDYHFVRELVDKGTLQIDFVPSHLRLADSRPKELPSHVLSLSSKLSVLPSTTLTLRG
ncbi:hypothetical protein AAG906_008002 [Vitis piasezkii]